MKNEAAKEIIRRAMSDRAVYDAMAARENEVWGRILPGLEHSEARRQDAEAAAQLRLARHQSSLRRVVKEKGLRFESGLTIGCGAGRCERALLRDGICPKFHGIDISEKAIAEARRTAQEQSLPLTYEIADLNAVELPAKAFDLVVAQTALHHVLFLEHVAAQVHRSLKPEGYLWIHDFIGETQGQYDEKRLSLINQLLAVLPEKFRQNKVNGRVNRKIDRPKPGRLGSPFEKIRSGEIVGVFERWFMIDWKIEFGAFMHWIVPSGTRCAYLENEDSRALFELLVLFDHLCIEESVVQPTGGMYLMRPRPAELPISPGEQDGS